MLKYDTLFLTVVNTTVIISHRRTPPTITHSLLMLQPALDGEQQM